MFKYNGKLISIFKKIRKLVKLISYQIILFEKISFALKFYSNDFDKKGLITIFFSNMFIF